jgi:hypothetical protein
LPGEGAFIEGLFFPDGAIVPAIGLKGAGALQNHRMTPVGAGVVSGIPSKVVIKEPDLEGWGSLLSPHSGLKAIEHSD